MVGTRRELLVELVKLLEKYDAEIYETTDGNGVHVEVGGGYSAQGFHSKQDMKDWCEETN